MGVLKQAKLDLCVDASNDVCYDVFCGLFKPSAVPTCILSGSSLFIISSCSDTDLRDRELFPDALSLIKMIAKDNSEALPLARLNFAEFTAGGEEERRRFCQDLAHSFQNTGFVKLINHGISDGEVDRVFTWAAKFFALPEEMKGKAAHPAQPNPHRGYSYVGQEKLSRVKDFEKGDRVDDTIFDVKESFDQGPSNDDMYPNRWPDDEDIPGFRTVMEDFYDKCHAIHIQLLEAIEISTGLPLGFFQNICNDNTSELRINHYPSIDLAMVKKGAKRISEHSDFGTVTLLFAESEGLQVEDQDHPGRYPPLPCDNRSDMIINIGDCLQRWTNGHFRSTSHRVVLPPGATSAGDRYSVAYFAKPNRTQLVGSLPEFLSPGQEAQYSAITAWEYNQQKLLRTY